MDCPMGVRDTDLVEFRRSAICPSRLRLFCYCECAAMLDRHALKFDLWPSPGAFRGFVRHEIHARKQIELLGQLDPVVVWTVGEAMDFLKVTISRALRERIILANSADIRTFCTMVPELVPGRGCYGYPDALDCRNGTSPVVVEAKYCMSRLPAYAWAADEVQAAAYLAGMVELGFPDAHASIIYRDRGGGEADIKLPYTPELETRLKATARRLDSVERGLDEPIPRGGRTCRLCRFRYLCAHHNRSSPPTVRTLQDIKQPQFRRPSSASRASLSQWGQSWLSWMGRRHRPVRSEAGGFPMG